MKCGVRALLFAALAGMLSAGNITALSDRSSFDTAVGATTLETFENAPFCNALPGPLNSASSFNCSIVGSIAPGEIQPGPTYSAPNSAYNKSFLIDRGGVFLGNRVLVMLAGAGPSGDPLTVTFANPVAAVGFDFFNVLQDSNVQFSVSFTFNTPGGGVNIDEPLSTDFSRFFGFQSSKTDITSISIDTNDATYEVALDNFSFGGSPSGSASATPEPATLFGTLAAIMAGCVRYRRRIF